MSEEDRTRVNGFLKDLAALTEKYGLEIGGCGECDSPWVCDVGGNGANFVGHLTYDRARKFYGEYAYEGGRVTAKAPK